MITKRGVGLVIAAIIVFFLSGATRVGWMMALDAVLWGAIVISAAMPWLSTGRLVVRRRVVRWEGDPGPSEGQAVEAEYQVTNTGRLPAAMYALSYNHGPAVQSSSSGLFIAWLGRKRTLNQVTKLTFSRRGLHTLPGMIGEASLPFGLFRRRPRAGAPFEVLVYPRVYAVSPLAMARLMSSVGARTRLARIGDQVVGSRRYAPGDPLRHIHWRNFARAAEPQVKEFEDTPEDALTIAFDAGRLHGEALEDAVRMAASVGAAMCRTGNSVRVVAGSVNAQFVNVEELLGELALLMPKEGASLSEMAVFAGSFAHVLAVVAEDDAPSQQALADLAARGVGVTVVTLRAPEAVGDNDGIARPAPGGMVVVQGRVGDVPAVLRGLEGAASPRQAVAAGA